MQVVKLLQPHVFGSACSGAPPETMSLDRDRLAQFKFELGRIAWLAALVPRLPGWTDGGQLAVAVAVARRHVGDGDGGRGAAHWGDHEQNRAALASGLMEVLWRSDLEVLDCAASQLGSLLSRPVEAVRPELMAALSALGGWAGADWGVAAAGPEGGCSRLVRLFKERVGFVLWRTMCAGGVSEGYLNRRGLGWLQEPVSRRAGLWAECGQLCGVCARVLKLAEHLEHVYLPIYSELLAADREQPQLENIAPG